MYFTRNAEKQKTYLTSLLPCEHEGANNRKKGKMDQLVEGWKYKLAKLKEDFQRGVPGPGIKTFPKFLETNNKQ